MAGNTVSQAPARLARQATKRALSAKEEVEVGRASAKRVSIISIRLRCSLETGFDGKVQTEDRGGKNGRRNALDNKLINAPGDIFAQLSTSRGEDARNLHRAGRRDGICRWAEKRGSGNNIRCSLSYRAEIRSRSHLN